MKTFIKRIAMIIAGAVALVVVVAIAAVLLFDAAAYKSRVETLVERETGRGLSITGDVSLSFFPGLGLSVGRTVLHNPPGFSGAAFGGFESLTVRLKLLPLLRGAVSAERLIVEGLRVHLVRSGSGKSNFDDLLARGGEPGAASPAAAALGGLRIVDAALTFENRQSGETFAFSDVHVSAGALSLDEPVPIAVRLDFAAPAQQITGSATLDTDLSLDWPGQRYGLDNLAVKTLLRSARIPGEETDIAAKGAARYDAKARSLVLSDIELVSSKPGLGDAPVRLSIPQLVAEFPAQTASMDRFAIDAGGLDIRGALAASALDDNPTVSGRVSVAPFSPREWLAGLGRPLADTGDTKSLTHARLEATFTGDVNGIALDDIDAAVDEARIGGRITVRFAAAVPVEVALDVAVPAKATKDPLRLRLRGAGRVDPATQVIEADPMEIALGPLSARGTLKADATGDDLTFTAVVEVPTFNARELLEHLGQAAPDTRDAGALTRVSGTAAISGTSARIRLEPLAIDVDDTRVTGMLSVSNPLAAEPAVTFTLRADALDSARYMPPKDSAPADKTSAAPAFVAPPLDALQSLDLDGRITVDELVIEGLSVRNVKIAARSKRGKLELRSESAPGAPEPAQQSLGAQPIEALRN